MTTMASDVVAASGGGDAMDYFWPLYLAQIGLSVFVLLTQPKDERIPKEMKQARAMAAWLGFVPCWGLMIIAQLSALAVSRVQIARLQRFDRAQEARQTEIEAEGRRPETGGGSSGRNPFL